MKQYENRVKTTVIKIKGRQRLTFYHKVDFLQKYNKLCFNTGFNELVINIFDVKRIYLKKFTDSRIGLYILNYILLFYRKFGSSSTH